MTTKQANQATFEIATTNINGFEVKVVIGYEDLICAVPCTGRMNSSKWDIIALNDGDNEFVCQLTKKELDRWMGAYVRNHIVNSIVNNDYEERVNNYDLDVEFVEVFASLPTNQMTFAF